MKKYLSLLLLPLFSSCIFAIKGGAHCNEPCAKDNCCKKTTASATAMNCPTCKKAVTTAAATKEWNGKTYAFCCSGCEASFTANPEKYTN